jgi:hypothetical protein
MATITVNNMEYSGRTVQISNGKVIIDGKDVTQQASLLSISVVGDIDRLEVDACRSMVVTGNVKKLSTASGDVSVGGTTGSVETASGDVECRDVTGNVKTMSGDVECWNVGGDIETMSGDVKHKK